MNCRIASCARVLPAVPALMLAGVLAACARTSRTPEPPAPPAGTALTAPADLPPAYDEARLIEIEQPRSSSVRVGIAPETIRVDVPAGVVRYVAVARGISAQTASYEGIRCNGGQWRVFARRQANGPWLAADSAWQDIGGPHQQPYVRRLARESMCLGPAVNTDTHAIVRALQTGGRGTLYSN